MNLIEFCAGAGGEALGLEQAGFWPFCLGRDRAGLYRRLFLH